jgi:hypothetical protein
MKIYRRERVEVTDTVTNGDQYAVRRHQVDNRVWFNLAMKGYPTYTLDPEEARWLRDALVELVKDADGRENG